MEQKKKKHISIPFKPLRSAFFGGDRGVIFTGYLAPLAFIVIPGSQYSGFIVVISFKARESQNKDDWYCKNSVLLPDSINIVQKYNAV